MSEVRLIACDLCNRVYRPGFVELTRLSCQHDVCGKHRLDKNERGEPQCPKNCGSVYIREVLS